jgi:hypothetical protein
MFTKYDTAIKNLGIVNYALFGIPYTDEDFYEMFKPVVGKDETETVIYASTPEQYPITFNQLKEEVERIVINEVNTEYQRLRKAEYPSISDQLDALYHYFSDNNIENNFTNMLNEIKNKYPKPE